MDFRIADTFTDSLSRLTGDEEKAVKTTAFDLQPNPANPGFSFHKLEKAKDKNFWSVRVSSDIRLIVHKTQSSLLLCYVDHHDKAYDWAERRRLDTHPRTGAAPWEKWTVFLHPEQRQWVERDYNGPARVSGSARTGKTIVALHRAAFLARTNPDARILLATFSDTLAHALHTKLRRLIGSEPRLGERIEVHSLNGLGIRLYKSLLGPVKLASRNDVRDTLKSASQSVGGHKFSLSFLLSEWEQIVDAWQLASWEAYRDVTRLGRKTRLPEGQRAVLWSIFEKVRSGRKERGVITQATVTELHSKSVCRQIVS